jgi:hypothetical protein
MMMRGGRDIILRPITFYMIVAIVLIMGMGGMWLIGNWYPGTFGVTAKRNRAANVAMRLRNMRRRAIY